MERPPEAPGQGQQPQQSKLQEIKEIADRFRWAYHSKIDVCPRCGMEGTQKIYIRKNKSGGIRKYVYVHHRLRSGREYTCYIGPVDDYVYVQRLHGDLALTHLGETNYAEVIAQAAEKYIKQLERLLEQEDDEKKKKRVDVIVYNIIDALANLVELARSSCESLDKEYREECLQELKEALSCSS